MATIYGINRGGNINKNMIQIAKAVMEKDIAKDVKKKSKTVLEIC